MDDWRARAAQRAAEKDFKDAEASGGSKSEDANRPTKEPVGPTGTRVDMFARADQPSKYTRADGTPLTLKQARELELAQDQRLGGIVSESPAIQNKAVGGSAEASVPDSVENLGPDIKTEKEAAPEQPQRQPQEVAPTAAHEALTARREARAAGNRIADLRKVRGDLQSALSARDMDNAQVLGRVLEEATTTAEALLDNDQLDAVGGQDIRLQIQTETSAARAELTKLNRNLERQKGQLGFARTA